MKRKLQFFIFHISKSFVRFPKGNTRSTEACCNDENLDNCLSLEVNPQPVLDKENISIHIDHIHIDIDLHFHSTVEPNGFVYKNSAGDEAVITYNRKTANMFATFKTKDKSYAIEKCHRGYVWKEFNLRSFGDDVVERIIVPDIPGMKKLVEAGQADTTTQATYSVMFYVSI